MAVPPDTQPTAPHAKLLLPEDAVDDARRRTWILVAMCTALVAVVASVSGLNVAQQDLAVHLGASQGELLWIINGYTIALAALLLPIGAVGDRWGLQVGAGQRPGALLRREHRVVAGHIGRDAHRLPGRCRHRRRDDHAGDVVGHHLPFPPTNVTGRSASGRGSRAPVASSA
ncbi:MAG: hypothetical protein M5U19_17975 [Microthrixaceae bacterium]|nr:hypothetical protein [Microthrixaceae bacterium]